MNNEEIIILDQLKEQWPIAEIKLRFALIERDAYRLSNEKLVEALRAAEKDFKDSDTELGPDEWVNDSILGCIDKALASHAAIMEKISE